MHCSTRDLVRCLVLALSAVSVAEASLVKDSRQALDKRQLTLSIGGPADPTTTRRTLLPGTQPTTAPSSTEDPTTRSTPPSSTPSASSSAPPPPPTTSSRPPQTSSTPLPSPETSTVIITATKEDGSPTTYATQTTSIPTNQPSNQNGGGMPESTKTTVIGVVVGIGGAIVLIVLGFLAWRIWGRNRQNEESDELMGYGAGAGIGSAGYGVEKTSEAGGSSQGRTPFQSTLESYHAPTHVNPSSNF